MLTFSVLFSVKYIQLYFNTVTLYVFKLFESGFRKRFQDEKATF